jgi:cytochrome P450
VGSTPVATTLFTDPTRFADLDDWRREALELHERGPIHRIERDGYRPFLAVIGHDAVMEIERHPAEFTNAPYPVLGPAFIQERAESGEAAVQLRTLIHMDDPEHGKYRKLTSDWFKPSSVRSMSDRLDELSDRAVERMRSSGGTLDFYRDVAMSYPLQVILSILGLPEDDYPRMLQLTQELFGGQDPDLQRSTTPEENAQVLMDFYRYFTELTNDRMAHPTDDLATLIANGVIDGEPAPEVDKLSYYVIVATAGHDTTAAAMAGGMRALAEHPDQLRLLQEDPSLLNNAVEEIIRWTSPVRHFMRTSHTDRPVAGVDVEAGDWLYLSYLAANLDPSVFEDPLRFDITRPNADRNISFGYGVHFCLGAQLARLELRSLFGRLVPELTSLELAGTPTTTQATFVGGHKTVPVRFEMR